MFTIHPPCAFDAPSEQFTGKERDGETGLDWFSPGRYFSGAQGRFTSTDPLNIPALQELAPKKFTAILSNPQNWNQYAYAHNNPLSKTDPDGHLTIIVPGTWNKHSEWEDSEFRKRVEKSFGEKAIVLPNSGMKNDKAARSAAAKMIVELVKQHTFADGEKLNIIAHSHGGNAVFEATKGGLDHKIDNLVTLGTPIRGDYRPDCTKIGGFLNSFSRNDQVQTSGGGIYGLGDADRQIRMPQVENLDATGTATSPGDLWERLATWDKVVEPKLKK
ncbi:MAG: RHS repeat-associated core domain-containing protein [Acidobacteria bacterium]|nr:RHS repeat-associated core domain-containing protein [Acidobacteriota bacterium]